MTDVHRDLLEQLVPRLLGVTTGAAACEVEAGEGNSTGSLLDRVPVEHVHGLMQDRTCSRFLEVHLCAYHIILSWRIYFLNSDQMSIYLYLFAAYSSPRMLAVCVNLPFCTSKT
jgi:hypothetical protein